MENYEAFRSEVLKSGNNARVEVNQRALIDKILARYASQNAIYRELLQNSNDAEAKTAEIRFTTAASSSSNTRVVTQVVYRNNGHPFRDGDWSRLRKIAEGNPDETKIGAFGVGAYTMFSICEEPLVISGSFALAFSWRGDALWARLAPVQTQDSKWTTFVLPSRDVYPLPEIIPFAQFLCASLTFTNSLCCVRVFVDEVEAVAISKRVVEPPTPMPPPRATSWWAGDGMTTSSPHDVFSLGRSDSAVTQSIVEISVQMQNHSHSIHARYVSAVANVSMKTDMLRRVVRVTKKSPPRHAVVHIFLDSSARVVPSGNPAAHVTRAFSPNAGAGSVFIGFRTSQTTGFAAHLAAPFFPTVEREAIDFQDSALKIFNSDLLVIAGILMRLTLEHGMGLISTRWEQNKEKRAKLDRELEREMLETESLQNSHHSSEEANLETKRKNVGNGGVFGFVRFMTTGVKRIAEAITTNVGGLDEDDVLNPPDPRPLSDEERDAIMLMKAFSPQPSTPDELVGGLIAGGFSDCMPKQTPHVLTISGVVRAADSRLPFHGIEAFVTRNVVRKVVAVNAESYVKHVAGCRPLSVEDLIAELVDRPLAEHELIKLIKWWVKFSRAHPEIPVDICHALRSCIAFFPKMDILDSQTAKTSNKSKSECSIPLNSVPFYRHDVLMSTTLPMPPSVLSIEVQKALTIRLLQDKALSTWFRPLPFFEWARYIVQHPCMNDGRIEDSAIRLEVLAVISKEYEMRQGDDRNRFEKWLVENLSNRKCIPFHNVVKTSVVTDCPTDLYLPDAETQIFEGLGSFNKISPDVQKEGVSRDFLVAIGVRKSIAIDFLFSQLENLKWNNDPRPLIRYLRTAVLSPSDLEKLKTTQYLPEIHDKSQTYSPSELLLPNRHLALFPHLKVLQWQEEFNEKSADGEFLKKIGCKQDPPLSALLPFIANSVKDNRDRECCLEYVARRLGTGGLYVPFYSKFLSLKFLPVVQRFPFENHEPKIMLQSPTSCYSDATALCMGFAVLDPSLDKGTRNLFAARFQCRDHPVPSQLVAQMRQIITFGKKKIEIEPVDHVAAHITFTIKQIFKYLSTRTGLFSAADKKSFQNFAFIPFQNRAAIHWHRPDEVCFKNSKDDISSLIYKSIEFDPFLAFVGVRHELSIEDLRNVILSSPSDIFEKVGEERYLALLRRLAASVDARKVSAEMRRSPFLLAYRNDDHKETDIAPNNKTVSSKEVCLEKSENICIVDNSFFSRMFPVLIAPQESDLEHFYAIVGSSYISNRVQSLYGWSGRARQNTSVTKHFFDRLMERRPLLVLSNSTSRPLKSNAASILVDENVSVYEVERVTCEYRLNRDVRKQSLTCGANMSQDQKCQIYITENVDWFDVGNAIGQLILKRCRLEDAFLLGSILEASLHQLRTRGFPVDRIFKKPGRSETKSGVRNESPLAKLSTDSRKEKNTWTDESNPRGRTNDEALPKQTDNGFETILKQMFPDCSLAHIRSQLGPNPTLETLHAVAESLKKENISRESSNAANGAASSGEHDLNRIRRRGTALLKRAFGGREQELGGVGKGNWSFGTGGGAMRSKRDYSREVSTGEDAAVHQEARSFLQNSVRASQPVPQMGFSSSGGIIGSDQSNLKLPSNLTEDMLDCDLVQSHTLVPWQAPSHSDAGLPVFATSNNAASVKFLQEHWSAVKRFAIVLLDLARVCRLDTRSVAIYHESVGRTIAFNRNRSLFFNVRYFVALHDKNIPLDEECYIYWLTIMSHELAHNSVSSHGPQHGKLTEQFVIMYMPQLIKMLPEILRKANNQR